MISVYGEFVAKEKLEIVNALGFAIHFARPPIPSRAEQAKNALYSKTIILPEIVDRSVYHVDPKMPTGGMIGAFRCFRVDLKDAQVEMDECKKNEMKL